jgi:hypothetical protein
MILKFRDIPWDRFNGLVRYLTYEGTDNSDDNNLVLGDVVDLSFYHVGDNGERVVLVQGNTEFEFGLSPWAKMLSAKPHYDSMDCLNFSVEIEIPDQVHVGVLDSANKLIRTSESGGAHYVDPKRFFLEINEIILGNKEEAQEAE